MTHSTRSLRAWNIGATITAVQGAIAFLSGDGITFNSFGFSLGIKKGQKPVVVASYDLTFGSNTKIRGNFTYNGTAGQASGRHLLQMDQFKSLVIKKLISSAIGYLKTKFPKIAPFLPKSTECSSKGKCVFCWCSLRQEG